MPKQVHFYENSLECDLESVHQDMDFESVVDNISRVNNTFDWSSH